jgi:DNA-binding NtrC family response regulator
MSAMSTESHILVIDDDPDIAKAARLLLERHGMRVSTAASPEAAWVLLAGEPVDVILLDLNFARGRTTGEEGFAMLDRLIAGDARAVVIVVTGHSGIAVAVRAMRSGATDFVIKPWNNERLLTTVERGLALRRAKLEIAATPPIHDGILLGESAGIARARDLMARVASTAAPILIHGAAGTGKTLIARLVHQASPHAGLPFVTLDAEAANAAVIAERTAAAAGGLLVIDHIDRLPRALSGVLLSALEGIRVIATTRLDRTGVRAAIGEDLLDRVGTIEIALPHVISLRCSPTATASRSERSTQTQCRRSRRIAGPTTSAACVRRWNVRCCSAIPRPTRSATSCFRPGPSSRNRSRPTCHSRATRKH